MTEASRNTRIRQWLSHSAAWGGRWLWRLRPLGVVFVLAALALALWKVPEWQVPDDATLSAKVRFELEDKARKTLAQMLGGGVLLYGLYLTSRRITVTERTAEAAHRTADAAQERQLTERFTRAIEQLGSMQLEVRLGGIYALERIAKDSPRDHWRLWKC